MSHQNIMKRMRALLTGLRVLTVLVLAFSAFGPQYATPVYADKLVCGIPGRDGPASISGVVNTYYPGTANVSAASTSIPVGSPSGATGTPIQTGDLLLVIQMQGADINSTNTGAYGDGTAGDPATGITSSVGVGQYEYVVATSDASSGSVAISSGLVYSYSTANYPVGAGNQGQRRFQVIRVPQYSSATIAGTVTSLPWNGSVGGVVALDVAGTLNFNGNSVNVSAQGFRGGGGVIYGGDSTPGLDSTDYRTLSTIQANASKGEGIAGTPRFIFNGTTVVDLGIEGYPNGSFARGAPGNAGGGGTDGVPTTNEDNTGGGGGGNGGAGGIGGFGWRSISNSGGFGGSAFPATASLLVMGGGGGAGTINNNNPLISSGGAGGGVVMVRAGTVTGSGTINANGADGQDQILNDSGGGAGAGGSVLVVASNPLPAGLSINANGGNGGDAWPGQAPGAYPGERHGPGAGGGGGVIFANSGAATFSVQGGQNGLTTTAGDSYGSNPGLPGRTETITANSVTTGISGAECIPNPTVVKTTSTPVVTQTPTGTTGQYTIVVSMPANDGTALGFNISDSLPTGFTYNSTVSINPTGGATRRASPVDPTTGDTDPTWGIFDIPGGGQVEIIFNVDIAASVPAGVYQNPATAEYTDPTRTVSDGTTTTSYDSGSSTGEDIEVITSSTPSLSVVKSQTSTGPYVVGNTINYNIVVTNTGNVDLTNVTVTDSSATLGACTPAQPATLAPAATMTCPATHVVTQADVDAASYTNTATADSDQTPPATSSVTVDFVASPALSVVKNQTSNGPYAAGDTITYSIVVTNTGNVTLTGVTATDNAATLGACTPVQPATLAPNASMTCSATHVVTQADIDSGSYINTATGDSDQTPPGTSTVTVPFTPGPSLNVVKTESGNGPYAAGDTINYSIVVTNTGNITLTNVTVADNSATVGICSPVQPSTLTPGATMTCPASHLVTQADVDNGSYTNIATADSEQTPPDTDTEIVEFANAPALSVVKSQTSNGPYELADIINYSIVVTNTGSVTLTGVTVADNSATVGTCSPAQPSTLAPAATMTCPASHVVTQADLDNGSYANTATADSDQTPPSTSSVTVDFSVADLTLVKTVSNATPAVSDVITFTLTVTNIGPDPATNVEVTDHLPSGFTLVSASPGQGTYNAVTRVWSIGNMAVNGTATLTMQVLVNATGEYTNIAEVSAAVEIDPDSTPNNNNPNEDDQGTVVVSPARGGGGGGNPAPAPNNPAAAASFLIPVTGFKANVVTDISHVAKETYTSTGDVMLEIPSLNVKIPIVGVPKKDGTWNVSWLTNEAGWLEGSAFPSWNGNSVLTSHVYLASGLPGPFVNLNKLKYGDTIIVHAYGQKYTFAVQTNEIVSPNDRSVMKHEEKPWLTLITCKDYDEKTRTYRNRVAVRAILVKVEWE